MYIQSSPDTYGKYNFIVTEQWLNRYKKLIKKFKTIETHEHKYVFYKIKNLKSLLDCYSK